MTASNIRTLTARYVFPVAGEPIPNGTVTIAGDRIVDVGRLDGRAGRDHRSRLYDGGPVEDLGNAAILPGLVNAHTHLEFSGLAEPLGQPGIAIADWLRLVIEGFRQERHGSQSPVRRGLKESLRLGTTSLGEIAQPTWSSEPFERSPIGATVFLELIAPTPERVDPLLATAPRHVDAGDGTRRWLPGLSPHAPYTVLPRLLDAAIALSRTSRVPLAFHLAESREELELLRSGTGPLRDYFETLGTCDPALFTPGSRPLDYLRKLAEADRVLVIHGNYLDADEIALLAEHAERMAVVYCPRTHAHFGHQPYPLARMLAAGVTVALGTDSRASAPDLSVLAEMRCVAQRHPEVPGDVVLRLGTLNAAAALGRAGEVGSLEPGKFADLAVVALPEHDAADPHELLFDSSHPVVATICHGANVGRRPISS